MWNILIALLLGLSIPAIAADNERLAEDLGVVVASPASMPLPMLQLGSMRAVLLHQASSPLPPDLPGLQHLRERLLVTMRAWQGDGIAAVQTGLPWQILLLTRYDRDGFPVMAMVNPVVITQSGQSHSVWDGCLSVPGGYGRVKRLDWLEVRYRDIEGNTRQERFSGKTAAVLQHELDHLNGILFVDHIPAARLIPHAQFLQLEMQAELACDEDLDCPEAHDALWLRWQEAHRAFQRSLSD